jgi:DNA topoisomerase IA
VFVGFVVERFNRIRDFVSEPFWYLQLTAEKAGQTAVFSWKRSRLYDEPACVAFYERCIETITNDPSKSFVESVRKIYYLFHLFLTIDFR